MRSKWNNKSRLSPVIPGAFHSQSLQVFSWHKAVETWDSKPAVIPKNWCWPAGQANYGSWNVPFHLVHRALPLWRQLENLRWQPLGTVFVAFRHSPPRRGRAGGICCQHAVQESKDWPWLWVEDEKQGKAWMTVCCKLILFTASSVVFIRKETHRIIVAQGQCHFKKLNLTCNTETFVYSWRDCK